MLKQKSLIYSNTETLNKFVYFEMFFTSILVAMIVWAFIGEMWEQKYVNHMFAEWYTNPITDIRVYNADAVTDPPTGVVSCPD